MLFIHPLLNIILYPGFSIDTNYWSNNNTAFYFHLGDGVGGVPPTVTPTGTNSGRTAFTPARSGSSAGFSRRNATRVRAPSYDINRMF